MSFANSFWTHDYHVGYEVLFDELAEGIKENDDFIELFTKRMELELAYGLSLEQLPSSLRYSSKRHANEDYVLTIKNAYGKLNENFAKQGAYHLEIARNIQTMVLEPFLKWCADHEQRVGYLELVVTDQYKHYKTARANLDKLLKKYFNKCRMLEEFKSHYSEEELAEIAEDVHLNASGKDESNDPEDVDSTIYTFAGHSYDSKTATTLLSDMLSHIELTSHKVPILGTYHNVSSGSAITQWLLDNMPEFRGNIAKAEKFGQDLVTNGFIRLIGSMGANKNFINSSQFLYQWKPLVFDMTKLSEFDLSKTGNTVNYDPIAAQTSRTNQLSNYFEDVKQAIGVTTVDYTDKSQYLKLTNEVNTLDLQYFQTTKELDRIRCTFEETVMDHLSFMQKCELDRLKAIKKAMFDFLATFSNKVSALKHACDELFVVEETIHPVNDLKFLIENYATGKFNPRVTLYDNYYDSNIKQTFGVDLNVKSRLDRKAVPVIVQAILSYLDEVYPELSNDEERVGLWTQPVHLSQVHALRFKLNELTDIKQIHGFLKENEATTVTNVLKLYFMELPDSIVPYSYFDLIKTLYQNYPVSDHDENVDKSRITGLQNTLLELPVSNLATLDALLTHLTRLVSIVSSKNEKLASQLKTKICKEFGNVALRPKLDSSIEERSPHLDTAAVELLQQNLMADFFENKNAIFGELRRRNSKPREAVRKDHTTLPSAKTNVMESSKSRLENRLKRAVTKTSGKPQESDEVPPAPPSKTISRSTSPEKSGSLLRRSVSPKKRPSSVKKAQSTESVVQDEVIVVED
ncbi:CIC11C00000001976 [Sungouiella intermedia]|uniref:CIC11C00000001976 n=1 Tax=Sungouiella intermedia TaxID=45354 RepID=A0A1L0GA91_9ASCO|nr:CIC11C00000001976 [[Candida] intermedia]